MLKLGGEGWLAFYDLRHQAIYKCLTTLKNDNDPIDVVIVMQWLQDRQQLEQVGGLAYLGQLQDSVPSAANLDYYLDIVKEKHQLRRLITTCTEVVGKAYEFKGTVNQLMDEAEKEVLAINAENETAVAPTVKEFVAKAITNIETGWGNGGLPSGIATGFVDLDKHTDGLHNGNMIVIAARPSLGKTSLAMNIVEHVCLTTGLPVGVFSLEMTGDELVERMLGSVARVNIRSVKQGHFMESAAPKLTMAAGKINSSKLFIDDTGGLSIMQLRARARRMHAEHGIKLFVIDYLQLLHADVGDGNREREVSLISSGIKELAKELKVPVIVLSQFNRELEKEKRKPRLSDLRESGSIEQDADVVGLLYKPNIPGQDPETQEESDAGQQINLLIAKQRNGPRDVTVKLTFLNQFTRFESYIQQVEEQDLPNNHHND